MNTFTLRVIFHAPTLYELLDEKLAQICYDLTKGDIALMGIKRFTWVLLELLIHSHRP